LPFEDLILRFHQNSGSASTASSEQVRRWRKNARKTRCPRSNIGRYFYVAMQHEWLVGVLLNK
jgi:hypothetical protein